MKNKNQKNAVYMWAVFGSYDGGRSWDLEAYAETYAEALDDLRAYQENGGGLYRLKRAKYKG